jgi:hypothetical protein
LSTRHGASKKGILAAEVTRFPQSEIDRWTPLIKNGDGDQRAMTSLDPVAASLNKEPM